MSFKKSGSIQPCKSSAPDLLNHSFNEVLRSLLPCTRRLAKFHHHNKLRIFQTMLTSGDVVLKAMGLFLDKVSAGHPLHPSVGLAGQGVGLRHQMRRDGTRNGQEEVIQRSSK